MGYTTFTKKVEMIELGRRVPKPAPIKVVLGASLIELHGEGSWQLHTCTIVLRGGTVSLCL